MFSVTEEAALLVFLLPATTETKAINTCFNLSEVLPIENENGLGRIANCLSIDLTGAMKT